MDLCSRRLVGWAVAEHMRAELVADALHTAKHTRGSLAGAIFHSDHGAQYSSRAFADACRIAGVTRSMGAVGSSADNAAAESFNASFKRRNPPGRPDLVQCKGSTTGRIWLAAPLQHPTPPLPPRPEIPDRLRDNLLPTPATLTHAA
jgi:transposase InsO family protein